MIFIIPIAPQGGDAVPIWASNPPPYRAQRDFVALS